MKMPEVLTCLTTVFLCSFLAAQNAAVENIIQGNASFEKVENGKPYNILTSGGKIESITDSVTEHGKRLLDEKVAAAEKMAELYDENGEFRKDLIDEVMAQAVALSLGEEPEMLTCETTVSFVYKAERWQAVPDQTLMRALQGGLN
jgi:hypothetical protein